MKIYELYDKIVGDTISYHTSVNGAVLAMSKTVAKLAAAMESDYGTDSKVNFEFRYVVKSIEVIEDNRE